MSSDVAERPRFVLIDHSISGEGGHYLEYARHVLDAAFRQGFHPVLVTHESFGPTDLRWPVHRIYDLDAWGRRARGDDRGGLPLKRWLVFLYRATSFARATISLRRALDLRGDDVVFMPTISEIDFAGLCHTLRQQGTAAGPSWNIVFRRELYGPADTAGSLIGNWLRRALLRYGLFELGRSKGRAHLFTDTARLAEQYRRLCVDVATLPIPVNSRFRPRAREQSALPLEIVFLGDARTEKGYGSLPSIVAGLASEVEAGRIHFTFQSNFGFGPTRSEARVVEARATLRRLGDSVVRLREEPMKSEDYERLVMGADIVLVPYNARRYFARSSGVFAEAVSAGVPVVVPAHCWMADQIQPEDVALHDALLEAQPGVRSIDDDLGWRPVEPVRAFPWLAHRRSTFVGSFRPRTGETHLILQFRVAEESTGESYRRVCVNQFKGSARLRREVEILGTSADGRASALFEIDPAAQSVEIVFSGMGGRSPGTDLRAHCLARGAGITVPRSAVGRTFVGRESLDGALREVIANYSHYRTRASAFSDKWVRWHNSDRLLLELRDARGQVPGHNPA